MAFFKPNIPLGTDFLSTSQGDLLGNNQWMPAAMGKDHIINAAGSDSAIALEGRHQQVSFNDRAAVLSVPGGTDGIIWHNAGELWWRGGASAGIQLTRGAFGVSNSNQGYSFLPGNLIIQWGSATAGTGDTVNFAKPFTSTPWSIQLTPAVSDTSRIFLWVQSAVAASFKPNCRNSNGQDTDIKFTWIAIGK